MYDNLCVVSSLRTRRLFGLWELMSDEPVSHAFVLYVKSEGFVRACMGTLWNLYVKVCENSRTPALFFSSLDQRS